MATGKKTYNGAIGMDINQKPLPTILELAELAKWATGILTTTHVTHATPACFYGHQPERRNVNEKLALDFLSTDIEVLMGGGWKYFQQRSDGRNLMEEAQNKGYFVVNDITKVGEYRPEKMICLISSELPEKAGARADFLPIATSKAIEVLDYPSGGFFLVIEGGQIDWGGHNKDSEYIIQEMLDFDKAIAKALAFAEKDGETLVVVTADHETGGYSINGGDLKTGEVTGLFTSDYHTATMVPVFAYGPGAESFAGVYDNTEIFYKFKFLMGLK
jgi:alkaline phosphatase